MNYTLLFVSFCLLLSLGYIELTRRGTANIILLALIAESILLVQGQALFLLMDLSGQPEILYPGPEPKIISVTGFTMANLCVTASLVILAVSYTLTRSAPESHHLRKPQRGEIETAPSYAVVAGVVALGIAGLAMLFGGLRRLLHHPGTMVGGQTLVLILLFWGKMPLLHKTAYRRRPAWVDHGLFLLVLFFLMLNSRFLALVAIAEYAILYHYRSVSRRLGVRALAGSIVALAIVFVYGTLRNFADLFHTYDLRLLRLYYLLPQTHALNPLALLYEQGESAFSGFAGILSAYCAHGISYDFGASNLQLLLHLLPNTARSGVFTGLQRWVATVYPYHGSVLPGGYEAAFAHLGFIGVLLFSVVLGSLPALLHRRLTDPGADFLFYGITAANLLTLFILDWWGVAFFLLADLSVLYAYRVTLVIFRPVPLNPAVTASPGGIADACE